MSESQNLQQSSQNILSNVTAESITTGDITQIYKIFVNLERISKPKGIPQNIISSSTDKFVGRERELENLNQQLQRHNQVVIAAVEGMGGVGKTELAIQYSLLNLQLKAYPGGICWLRSRGEDIGLQIVNFARTDLDLNPPDDLELPDRVRWCWKRWREENALIIFDDVKNYSEIKPYLPPQPSQFKILITTRLKLDLPSSLYLAVLSEPDALKLLSQLVGKEKVEQELEKAKELCQRLGYLPLALQLVGRYVKKRKISLSEELRRLEEKGLRHPSMDVPENDPSWTLDIKRGVEAAFELSWDELKKSQFAQELGCLLSLFALAPIPWTLVENAVPDREPESLEDARIELENLHLLQGVELENLHLLQGKETYCLHQLIREFFQKKLEQSNQSDEMKQAFAVAIVTVAKLIHEPIELTREHAVTLSPAMPHLEEVVNHLIAYLSDEDLILPLRGLGWLYQGQGFYDQASTWLAKCLAIIQSRFGCEHPDVAESLINLAFLYKEQDRYNEAESLYLQGLELNKRLFGENHPQVATSLNNLAILYQDQGRYSEAESFCLQSLELRKRLLGGKHTEVAISLNNLAMLYQAQGRYSEAESFCLQALKLRKHLFGEEHHLVATSLNNLAYSYWVQGRYDEAEPLWLKALELNRRLLGNEHRLTVSTISNLAALYRVQGRYNEAEPLYIQALELRKHLLGEEHTEVGVSLYGLAMLYEAQGRYSEVQPLYVQALAIFECSLGSNGVWTVKCRESFSHFLKQEI